MASSRRRLIRKDTYAKAKTPIIAVGIVTTLVAIVGFVWLGWWDIAQNRRVLSTLPVPPGTERVEIDSHPVARDDLLYSPPRFWSTAATFEIPGYSREYLLDFYVSRLSPEWEYCIREFTPGVRFAKNGYTLSLSTEGASSPKGGGSFRIHIAPDGRSLQCG